MEKKPKIAILGAGSGGQTMACDLLSRGIDVNIYSRERGRKNIDAIKEKGGIEISGEISGLYKPDVATTNLKEAVEDVDIIMVLSRAMGHEAHVQDVLPYLESGQVLMTWSPYWFCLRFANLLKDQGLFREVGLAEAISLPYMTETVAPGKIFLRGIKRVHNIGVMPAEDTEKVVNKVKAVFPNSVGAKNVLETSLANGNIIIHPPVTILNTGLWEQTNGDFEFYGYGVTPGVGRMMDAMDKERMEVGKAFDLTLYPQYQWNIDVYGQYGSRGKSMYEVLHTLESHRTWRVKLPLQFFARERVFGEDMFYGLVPLASLGKAVNVPTKATDTMINAAALVTGIDYWSEGLTVEKMGLAGLTPNEMIEYVTTGEKPN